MQPGLKGIFVLKWSLVQVLGIGIDIESILKQNIPNSFAKIFFLEFCSYYCLCFPQLLSFLISPIHIFV